MREAFICDAVRTPIGRFGGALAQVRADDLAAVPIRALMARQPRADWDRLEDVVLGCANQAGEDRDSSEDGEHEPAVRWVLHRHPFEHRLEEVLQREAERRVDQPPDHGENGKGH